MNGLTSAIGVMALCLAGAGCTLGWSYFFGQSEGKAKVDFDWV